MDFKENAEFWQKPRVFVASRNHVFQEVKTTVHKSWEHIGVIFTV